MKAHRKMPMRLAAVAAVSALVLAACGGGSETATTETEAPAAEETAEVTPDEETTAAESTETAAACESLTPVTLLLDWFPNPDHVALYVTQAKGYWEQECLEVTLQPPSDPADPPKLVSTGNVELGVSYQPEMYFQVPAGLKITAVASLVPTALNAMMWLDGGSIKSVADLGGKTIGEPGFGSNMAYLNAIFKANNIDPSTVKVVVVKTALSQALTSGAADAVIGVYGNIEGEQMKEQGFNPVITPVSAIGVPNYDELVIIANSERLAAEPEYQNIVKKFLAGLAKGNADAIADPTFSEQTMAAIGGDYAGPALPLMIEATLPLLENPLGFGKMNPASWDKFGAFMIDQELVEAAPPAADLLTNDYLP
jgi:putative hydroxymethylpyrimidine transport system substrate-binding protein